MALDKELARLQPLIDIGIGAKTNIANLQQGLGVSQANLRVGGATGTGNIGAQMMPSIAEGVAQQGNIAATDIINRANLTTNLISGVPDFATQLFKYIKGKG